MAPVHSIIMHDTHTQHFCLCTASLRMPSFRTMSLGATFYVNGHDLCSHGLYSMAYAVMAYIVMAYALMAYAVMACIVMAYTVMVYIVMACIGRAYIAWPI